MRLSAALLSLTGLLAAQEPPPVPTPVPTPAPAPVTQEPAPVPEANAQGAPSGRTGGRRGGRGQGPGQARETLELPEFVPVAAPPVSGLEGKQYFWFGLYPDFIAQYDPVTDTLVKKVKLANGMFWSETLTHDRKRLLVVTDQQRTIEVVDFASGTLAGTHTFLEDGFILRVRELRECPGGVHWLVRTDRIKKEVDRYSFEPAQWLLYDSKQKKTLRKIAKLPEAMDRGAQLSADGTQWLSQDNDGNLLFLDARKLTEVGKIDLRTPVYFGAGALRLSGTDLLDRRDPKRALMLFTSQDPVERTRTSWGVVELDLEHKKIVDVQEWGPQAGGFGMRVAPKKKIGASMSGGFGGGGRGGGGGDNRSRLLLYDLTNGRKIAEALEEFRPRRSLVAISPDADKIYIGTAGSDFEVFDASLKRLKTVELEGEIYGRIFVIDG